MPESREEDGRIVGTSAGGETVYAPAGDSSVSGEGGGDTLVGSSGDNRHWITHPKDVVIEQPNGGIDTTIGWTSIKLAPNVENLQVNGQFSYGVGNDLGNLIIADDTSHWLYGAGGDDVLVGSANDKTTFVVRAGEGSDVIYNWNGNSQVQLLNYGFSTMAQVRGAMTQQASDVVLKLSATETLTFRDETLTSFLDRQFLLPLDASKLGSATFTEEFDSLQIYDPSLQTGVWQASFGGNYKDPWAFTLPSNGERQVYTTPGFYGQGEADLDFNPFSISGGVLTITAERIPDEKRDAAWGREYSSGMLNTLGSFEQKYGYFEMKAELPTAAGSWPAFWMMPVPYRAQVEADIMEGLAVTPNVDYRRAWGGETNLYDNAYKIEAGGMHTYGMLWTPETVTFYYDRVAVLQAPTPANWTEPMAMLVNLAVGGWGGEPNSLQFPAQMKIDYVKAWGLAAGGTVVETAEAAPPAATMRTDGGLTSGQANVTATFEDSGQAVTSAKIAVYGAKPTNLPPEKTFVIWEDAGAVFGAVSNVGTLDKATALMAGRSNVFTGTGTWLTDGKVALAYMKPDGAGQAAWVMVFDPVKLTFTRHELGPSTGDIDIIATKSGGFAASWDARDGTVQGRAYDAFAYDGEGWYGPARTLAGDLTGVTANGELIATTASGSQQLYDVINPPRGVTAMVSIGPMAGVTHAEGDAEGTKYTFTITRDFDLSEKVTVGWTVRGQGANPTNAQDFVGGTLPSGVATFEINQRTATVDVFVAGDTTGEANEEFLVTLVNPVGAKLGQATATGFVTNDDGGSTTPPTVSFASASTVVHNEGDAGATAFTFTLTRTGDTSGATTVNWTTRSSGGQATAGDFLGEVFPTGTLTFAARETTKTISVSVAGDPTVEPDETFELVATVASGGTGGGVASGRIVNDDAATPGGGQVINSPGPGSTITGGAGADTINASQGADVITGGGGADVFAFKALPWNAGRITDFVVGTDKLDLSAIFQAAAYSGSDPVADGRMRFESDGAGGTRVYFDRDAPNAGDWPFLITTLENVGTNGLTWAQLSGGAAPQDPGGGEDPPDEEEPPTGGQVINSPGPGSTLTGGAGADTINASQGADVITGGGGSDSFVFKALPWSAGRITDFVLGTDKLDLSAIFQSAGYAGSNPVADGRMKFESDAAGGTRVYFDRDAPGSGDWPFLVTTLEKVSPTGLTWAALQNGGGSSEPTPTPTPGGGQTINSPGSGSTLTGGPGNDTLNASRGQDVLTGGAGADRFVFADENWAPATITDFVSGQDKIDLRGVLDDWGYTGSDPFADSRIILTARGSDTIVELDNDGRGGDWPNYVLTIQGVAPNQIMPGDWLFQ